jgi:polar amino acid transport system substrate-binding protein
MKKCMILFVLLWMIAGCSNVKSDALVVGMELAYPPFETKDNNGDPMGVSVELAKAFGEYLGREVIIENINWTGLIPALQTDKVDLVISSMTITEVRKESVDFSDGYAKAYLAFLVNNNSPVTTSANLNNAERTIAVKTGSTGDFYVTNNYPLAKVLRLDDESAAIAEVINGRADAFIYDQLTIVRNFKQYQDKTKTVFIDNQLPEFWGAAFKKGSPLVAQFNAFLKKFKEDKGFEPIIEQYLKEEKKLFDDFGFPFFFD